MRRTNVKYGRRASVEFSVSYVVWVSRSRIGLCVIYVHVESIGFLRVNLEHAHWVTFKDGACAVSQKRQLRGVSLHYHTTGPPHG